MIPLRDSIPARRTPVVTISLIVACALVFLVQLARPDLLWGLGMIPARVFGGEVDSVHRSVYELWDSIVAGGRAGMPPAMVPDWLTLLTCTFLHGGWLHILGNMLFLWIFGDNVEDRLGRVGFLVFYLVCGVAASASHLALSPESRVPTIGASGAIAGVMGAYMLLYPHSRVEMLIFFGFFVDVIVLPAVFFLGYWFLLQFLEGTMTLGNTGGGVAFWAHIGGFVAGLLIVGVLKLGGWLRPEPPTIRLVRRRYGRAPGLW